MTREAKKYNLTILGQAYTIVSDEPESLVMNAASLIDSMMKEIVQKGKHLDGQKAAVLTALQYASKFLAQETTLESIAKRERELLSTIEREMQSTVQEI